jgi:hypothetical protein
MVQVIYHVGIAIKLEDDFIINVDKKEIVLYIRNNKTV